MERNPPADAARPPLAHQASLALLRRELAQRWKVGDRLPPLKEWSRQLGVGQVSLQRAARTLVRQGYLMSRTRHGTFVRRLPELSESERLEARQHAQRQPRRRVQIVRTRTLDPFMEPALVRLTASLNDAGLACSQRLVEIEDPLPSDWVGDCDGGVLLQPQLRHKQPLPRDRAIVVLCTAMYDPSSSPVEHDVVSVDSERGGAIAGWHLRERGVESAVFVGRSIEGGEADLTSAARCRGFLASFGDLPRRHCLLVDAYNSEAGARAFGQWIRMPRRPEGVFCATDDLALGFIYAGLSRGMEPGRDYHIVGFDGQQRLREVATGSLASVAVPIEAMGHTAAQLLISRLDQPHLAARRLLLGCSLLQVGSSSAAALAV
jgi:DNA-binding transcriptional regulator YhcF (GntR family)